MQALSTFHLHLVLVATFLLPSMHERYTSFFSLCRYVPSYFWYVLACFAGFACVHMVKQALMHAASHTALRPHRRDDQVSRLSSAVVAASVC